MVKSRRNEFDQIYKQERLSEIKYLGMQIIPVAKVKGSVNRWRDFDYRFRVEDVDKSKFLSILNAIEKDIILPPISVYKVRDDYYVIDGNHRVAAAKQNGQIYIDAEVKELVPPADSEEHIVWRIKSRFEWKTGLSMTFSEEGSYDRVMVYIRLYSKQLVKKHGRNIPLKEVAEIWETEIFEPIITEIKRDRLMDDFPQHTIDDLFLYILHHQIIKSRLQGRAVYVAEAVKDFCIKECSTHHKITDIFKSFVFHKRCEKLCMNCAQKCPEGLICLVDGRLQIADACEGCGLCTTGCASANPVMYEEIAQPPT